MSQTSYLPWEQSSPKGLDLRISLPLRLVVGVQAELSLSASGPIGSIVDLVVGLAPGTVVDPAALDALVASQLVQSWSTEEGAVRLRGVVLTSGASTLKIPVTPGFAGTLLAGASSIHRTTGDSFYRVPMLWSIEVP
jgi:hypothetical protein